MTDLLARLKNVVRNGDGWTARCPAHDDQRNSLSIHHRDGRWLLNCHAGCRFEKIIGAVGMSAVDFFDDEPGQQGHGGRRALLPPNNTRNRATLVTHTATGLTLAQYATAKALTVDFLKSCGLSEFTYDHQPAVRIPYYGLGGEELAVRFRIGLEGDRFRWKSGTKPCLYGLHRLAAAQAAGQVVLVEGESDCHTLWSHGIPALGIPGAANWREDRDAGYLDGIETIYVVVEPDRGGDTIQEWLSRSSIRHRVKLIRLPAKDASALHLEDQNEFVTRWQAVCLEATHWTAVEAKANAAQRTEAWEKCATLAKRGNILDEFTKELLDIGMVGEERAAKLIFLALVSRLLDRPVSVAVKGPSSGGKSFLVESTLKFFPAQTFYALTAMSERALAYSNESLKHRHLVIYEAAGMHSEFATYLVRSLLSEGRLRYETVEKTDHGLKARLIEREGPTGLIVTTTSLRLHPENETRMLSITITDSREQTQEVFRALAKEASRDDRDLSPWHALQVWLTTAPVQVVIPFAKRFAELVPPVAIRLRRDFRTVLMLIRAHALLHQATRKRDERGRVIASTEDYAAVRSLVEDLVSEGVGSTVKPEVREVVQVTARLLKEGSTEVSQTQLRKVLHLDRAVISRRVAAALDAGFLRNREDRKGRPARLVLGDELPADSDVLPAPDKLDGHEVLRGCALVQGGIHPPPLLCPSALGDDVRPGVCAQCKANGATLLYPDPCLPHDGVWLHKECARYRASRGIT
jgi:hypothetical protein